MDDKENKNTKNNETNIKPRGRAKQIVVLNIRNYTNELEKHYY